MPFKTFQGLKGSVTGQQYSGNDKTRFARVTVCQRTNHVKDVHNDDT